MRRRGATVVQGAQRRAEVAGGGDAGGVRCEAPAETAGGDGEGSPRRGAGTETARGSSSGVRRRRRMVVVACDAQGRKEKEG